MNTQSAFKKPRSTTRSGRASATTRAEVESERSLTRDYLRLARDAGRLVNAPDLSDSMDSSVLDTEENMLRAEARMLDRRVRWNDEELHAFIDETALELHETRASRTEKIVKRVKARLAVVMKKGATRKELLSRRTEWPRAGGWTTFHFANLWARRVGYVTPPQFK